MCKNNTLIIILDKPIDYTFIKMKGEVKFEYYFYSFKTYRIYLANAIIK